MPSKWGAIFLVALFMLLGGITAKAQEFSSSNFNDNNPVIMVQGGRSTSTNFELFSGSGQTVIGESTSSAFTYRSGFFYFPAVTTPVISATAGNGQVSLTWTAAVGSLGFTVTAYEVGQATASGGPYTYTNVGNVLSNTATGLTNSTAYYFVVRVLDTFGNPIATSSAVSATPQGAVTVTPDIGSGDNESGYTLPAPQPGTVIFSGTSAPDSTVYVLRNGQIVTSIPANQEGNFGVSLPDQTAGDSIYSLYSVDTNGNKSSSITLLVTVRSGQTTSVTGVYLPPTIQLDKSAVKVGDTLTIIGQTVPQGEISIQVESPEDGKDIFIKTIADPEGNYDYRLDTKGLPKGSYSVRVRTLIKGVTTPWSVTAPFAVGEKSVLAEPVTTCNGTADLNHDCRVDLVDFSILIYWFDKSNPPATVDLNADGSVNLIDFSIMMYHWTG